MNCLLRYKYIHKTTITHAEINIIYTSHKEVHVYTSEQYSQRHVTTHRLVVQ